MWMLVVICVVLTFILAVWAQLDVFGVKLWQLIQFKRVSNNDS